MENHLIESEEFSDRFVCCVCLELLYKPIVLSCGHVSCFWCVHRSMSGEKHSHCPLCRHPYNHFPTICHLLHCLLLNLYPVAYNKRELQLLEQEKKTGYFSPQLDAQAWSSQANQDSNVLCAACKELLFRPVVLNCGHVYCESCIVKQDEEKITCQVCQSFHPTGYPKVCLDLQNFLIEQFPKELAHRRDGVQRNHVNPTTCESKSSKEAEKSSSGSYHRGVGCDYCGMYPIIGDRYRCKDCVEKIGFDLCNDCYNTNSKLPGRFNQQHTAEHQFELKRGDNIRGQLRRMSERLGDGSFAVLLAHMSGIPEEDAGNREIPHAPSTNSENDEDDQDGSQPSFQHGGI
ncbi:E3 ubiquitin-protein ligase PRT1-like [Rosa rugosa]|uniref:E3 ubiquitin-protein ligase PRT1-like n=1 Tax=Rosa rugosa TaxID=74645 RepID=UPI002B40D8B0|nr:E3 ubiquitin-protein ligase PRT1-like [Rosa rugosa]